MEMPPPVAAGGDDPLDWWKLHGSDLPLLSKMAREYLSVPATSVPVERTFSMAGDVVTKKRGRLAGRQIGLVMKMKSWVGQYGNNVGVRKQFEGQYTLIAWRTTRAESGNIHEKLGHNPVRLTGTTISYLRVSQYPPPPLQGVSWRLTTILA